MRDDVLEDARLARGGSPQRTDCTAACSLLRPSGMLIESFAIGAWLARCDDSRARMTLTDIDTSRGVIPARNSPLCVIILAPRGAMAQCPDCG